jgi:pilus assembly protein CpaF
LSNAADTRNPQYQALKGRVHTELLNRLNLDRLSSVKREDAEPELRGIIAGLLEREQQKTPLSQLEREALVVTCSTSCSAWGRSKSFCADGSVSDILVNRFDQVYVERERQARGDRHRLQGRPPPAADHRAHRQLVGRRIDESSPMVDARLQDGSRVNAIIPPLALDGPVLSIRALPTDRSARTISSRAIRDPADARLPEGGRSPAGSTYRVGRNRRRQDDAAEHPLELHRDHERVVTIEDAAELMLRQRHVVRLETRPRNIEGKGASRSANWSSTPCVCGPTASSSARCAARSARHAAGDEHRPRRAA